ncbi:oligosaccharide flippase family protein [Aristophania vespae]|uniref:Oligosaccharide flippase family protein n=1 Tax=Aristophania vespae TaxID=2697033 RepID=A0A6P1NN22_9PROT|nr:oligosaccharide flippase family protein [Aristophania vespae]QHI96251.1 oligosaccharide flippase family protein [Aristophania vespae]UMM64055.1 hypothetical protein DM15PD_10370 [Aristophania vespae]
MKRWFKDDLFKLVLKNAGRLASGKLVGALLGLGALACATHAMSPSEFGVLILIKAYAQLIADIGQFQGWQVILHYGSIPWQQGEVDRVKTATKFSVGLDLLAGFASMIVGMAVLLLLGPHLGVHPEHRALAFFYCTLIPFLTCSSPYGILRLFDRVDVISRQQIVSPMVRTTLSVLTLVMGWGLTGFVVAWYAGVLAADLYVFTCCWKELKRRNIQGALKPSLLKAARNMPKGMWSFVWLTSVNTVLTSVWGSLSNLLIGRTLGTAAAGLYSLAVTFIDAVQRPVRLLEKSYYPEVARLDTRTTKPWKLAAKMSFLGACLGIVVSLIVYIGGKPVISLFGHRYGEAATLMLWMAPSLVFNMAAFPLYGLLYTAGKFKVLTGTQLISSLFYTVLLIYMSHNYGLDGAGLAFAIGTLFGALINVVIAIVTFIRRRHIILPHEREIRGS